MHCLSHRSAWPGSPRNRKPAQESLPSLGHDRLGHWEDEARRKPTIKLCKEQAIVVREVDATAHLVLQHGQLMAERGLLRLKSAPRLERRGNSVRKKRSSATIGADVKRFCHQINTDDVFGTHKGHKIDDAVR
jgi:hypothetical protein